ncbi:Kelch repeat-containing protein [Haloactinospora alba]|nr:hypothetical protein [Haloactinospora alba]
MPEPIDTTAAVIDGSPLHGRYNHSVVWTGSEMIVWGGQADTTVKDGAAYDPGTDTWRTIAEAPVSAGSADTFMSGKRMVSVSEELVLVYDPRSDEWARVEPGFDVVDGAPFSSGRAALVGTDGDGVRVALVDARDGTAERLSARGIDPSSRTNLALATRGTDDLWLLAASTDTGNAAENATTDLYRWDEGEWLRERTDTSGYLVPASGTGVHDSGPAFARWEAGRLLSLNNASLGIHAADGRSAAPLHVGSEGGPCLSSRYTVLAGDELLTWSGPTCTADTTVTHPPTGLRVPTTGAE